MQPAAPTAILPGPFTASGAGASLAPEYSQRRCGPLLASVAIREGDLRDYDALSRFHYVPRRPAAAVRVLRAEIDPGRVSSGTVAPFDRTDGRGPALPILLGVLVVSMPVLNSRLRPLAWPGRYRTGDRRADARRINRELRTLSRVIVDPRVRGIGLATRLTRHYLDAPLTPATEGIAAMGVCSPFLQAAGMTPYVLPLTRSEARFIDALEFLGLSPARLLSDPTRHAGLLDGAFLRRELERFVRYSPRRRVNGASCDESILAVCRTLCSPRIAYAFSKETCP